MQPRALLVGRKKKKAPQGFDSDRERERERKLERCHHLSVCGPFLFICLTPSLSGPLFSLKGISAAVCADIWPPGVSEQAGVAQSCAMIKKKGGGGNGPKSAEELAPGDLPVFEGKLVEEPRAAEESSTRRKEQQEGSKTGSSPGFCEMTEQKT